MVLFIIILIQKIKIDTNYSDSIVSKNFFRDLEFFNDYYNENQNEIKLHCSLKEDYYQRINNLPDSENTVVILCQGTYTIV